MSVPHDPANKRDKWLAVRDTPRRRPGRLIWPSAQLGTYVRAKHGPIGSEQRRANGQWR